MLPKPAHVLASVLLTASVLAAQGPPTQKLPPPPPHQAEPASTPAAAAADGLIPGGGIVHDPIHTAETIAQAIQDAKFYIQQLEDMQKSLDIFEQNLKRTVTPWSEGWPNAVGAFLAGNRLWLLGDQDDLHRNALSYVHPDIVQRLRELFGAGYGMYRPNPRAELFPNMKYRELQAQRADVLALSLERLYSSDHWQIDQFERERQRIRAAREREFEVDGAEKAQQYLLAAVHTLIDSSYHQRQQTAMDHQVQYTRLQKDLVAYQEEATFIEHLSNSSKASPRPLYGSPIDFP